MDGRELRERREASRRALRRRRVAAGAAIIGAIAIAVVLISVATGTSTHNAHRSSAHARTAAAPTRGSVSSGASAQQPARAASGAPGHTAVPILMYHVIAPPPAGAPFPGLYVTPAEFAAQMHALKGAGWHAVTMDQLAAHWRRGASLGSGRPIVLTFDNGYR